jgi:PAS domain S-box-containing protein
VPAYGVEGVVKAATGAVSLFTAISVWTLVPSALAIQSSARVGEITDALSERERLGLELAQKVATEQKQAFQYARSLIEASLDPLVTIDPEGKITDVNEATIKITGVPRDDLIGTDFSDYFTEPDRAREAYRRVFAKGFVTDYALTSRQKDGRLTDVLYNASVYKDEDGKVLGVFATARDVTARKRAETEIAEQWDRELERLAELERFRQLTVGRELKMIELKKEITELNRALMKNA